jgi:hypothetical protein
MFQRCLFHRLRLTSSSVNGQLKPHNPSPLSPLLPFHPLSPVFMPCPTTWFPNCRNCSRRPPHSLQVSKPLSNLLPHSSTPSSLRFNRRIPTSLHPSHQRRMSWRTSSSRRTFPFRRRSVASARKSAIVSRRCLRPSRRAYPNCLLGASLRYPNRPNRQTRIRHPDPNRLPMASTGLMATLQKRSRVFVCVRFFSDSSFSAFWLNMSFHWPRYRIPPRMYKPIDAS